MIKVITHTTENDWGGSILVMEKDGKAFCRTYWFNDDSNTVYFDWLNVKKENRMNGIGIYLLNLHLETAIKHGAINSCLWVKKSTWVHDWYERMGYIDYKDHKNEENAIWMKKHLTTQPK